MKKLDQLNDFEVLNVDPKADATEIHMAYVRAKEALEPSSIAAYSLISDEEKKQLRIRIELAYRNLTEKRKGQEDAFITEQLSPGQSEMDQPKDTLPIGHGKTEKRADTTGTNLGDTQAGKGAAETRDPKKRRSFAHRFLSFMEKTLLIGFLLFVVIAVLIFMYLFLIPS